MSLGEKIKVLRKKRGMSQRQLAEASEVTQATISRIESGQVKELRSESLNRLATALGVTVDYLMGRTNQLTPDSMIESDSIANYLFMDYDRLTIKGRKLLADFARFLRDQEEKEKRNK